MNHLKPIGERVANEVLMHFRAMKKTAGDVSLSDSLDMDGEGMGVSLMDMLCCEDEALERVGDAQMFRQLRHAVDALLDSRQRQVIVLRYGLEGQEPLTQRETAKRLGISRSYISRIEKKALEILQQNFDSCM